MAKQPIDGNKLLIGYENHYSESSFWDKIMSVAKKAGEKVIYVALLLYYTALADTTPTTAKITIYSAIGYFILPTDLIPDAIPIVGFTDDAAALLACYKAVKDNITPEIESLAVKKTKEWFGNFKEPMLLK